jgi:hypothetical protein
MTMRWEDERYVRVYTRDSADWLALGWEAQALFVLTLRKVDRAGILDFGRHGVRGLASVVAMPVEVVERALAILVEDGCVKVSGTRLVVPNFIEAQEAPSSDAQRKRESRGRARDLAAAFGDTGSQSVTSGHENGQKVTAGHTRSQPVTPSCAVPSCTEEKKSEPLRLAPSEAPKPKAKTKTETDPVRRALSDALVAVYAVERGSPYGWDGAKDAEALGRLLGWSRDVSDHERRFRLALRSPAAEYGYRVDTIAQFATSRVWNHFAGGSSAPQTKAAPLCAPGVR